MGRNRRRRRNRLPTRDETRQPSATGSPPSAKPPWRETIDSWGGLTVVGSLAGIVILVVVIVVFNARGGTAGGGGNDYVPTERSQVDGRVEGDPNAPVRVIVFEDFQCPACKRFNDEIAPGLLEDFVETGVASVEFRHLAFLGPESVEAAAASECALDQNRFWDYHDLLFLRQGFQNRGVFSTGNLKSFARELQAEFSDFDLDAFDDCLGSGRKRALIEASLVEASRLGVRSTPSVFINGSPFGGAGAYEDYRLVIQAAADAAGN